MVPLQFTDSHCHLTDAKFDSDLDAVLSRAREAGVVRFITIGATGDFSHNAKAVALAHRHSTVFATVGVHPHDAQTITDGQYNELRGLAADPNVVGLGETGLDYFYDLSPRDVQRRHFRRFIRLARELNKPLSMHIRDAHTEAAHILCEEGAGQIAGVVHCFTGTRADASAFLDLGLSISFSGIMTFKNAGALRAVVPIVPMDRLLVETDSPYLTPVPFRGKRNEPLHVVRVASAIASIKDVPLEMVAKRTWENTRALFRLPD